MIAINGYGRNVLPNDAASVLKLLLIVGKLSFIFLTNGFQTSVHVLYLEIIETCIHHHFECLELYVVQTKLSIFISYRQNFVYLLLLLL